NPSTHQPINPPVLPMLPEFTNEPLTNFSTPENHSAFERALAKVRAELGREYDIILGGERVKTPEQFASINPSEPLQIVGTFQKGTRDLAEKSVEIAARTFDTWRWTPPAERAQFL